MAFHTGGLINVEEFALKNGKQNAKKSKIISFSHAIYSKLLVKNARVKFGGLISGRGRFYGI